jgi:hypothetical protein
MANLFGVNRKTCQRWLKNGLKPIEKGTNPALVMGEVLKGFLKEQSEKRKCELKDSEFFCMKCHRAVRAKDGSEKVIRTGKRIGKRNEEQIKKIGICSICETKINRFLGVCQQD